MSETELPLPLPALLSAAAASRPTRAESARRFVSLVTRDLPPEAGLDAVEERRQAWLAEAPPQDEESARRVLAAEDLADVLDEARRLLPQLERWREPRRLLLEARDRALQALAELGIELDAPDIHVGPGLPPAYEHPMLAAVSIDATDATHFGIAAGLHFDEARLQPGLTEATLGHVLVHAALGQRSPEHLGRGLEEGLCELLGGLHAGCAAGGDAVETALTAVRITPAANAQRDLYLGWVRAAASLHRRHGLEGLATLVREGRGAIKKAEAASLSGHAEDIRLPPGAPDPTLQARIDRIFEMRARPVAVAPLARYLCRGLGARRPFDEVAEELGVPTGAARESARGLMELAFVLLFGENSEVLVDDLEVVEGTGYLRYACEA